MLLNTVPSMMIQDIADILEKDSDMDQESTTPTNEDKETCLNPQCSEDGVANKHMLAHTTDNDISVQNDIRVTQSKSPLKRKQNNNSTEEPEPYSSDDELPLKTIQLKIRKEMCEMDADYYSDDSVKDPTFSIKEELKKMRKIKQNYKVREKGWKRKPTALNNKKKACPGRPKFKDQEKTKDSEFRRALSQSKKVFMAKQVILKYHIKTLDALLASNGLQKKSVDGDGNCFFSAIHNATQIYGDQNELRKGICDYIQSNKEDFTPFLTSQEQDFECQIQKLRENGIWAVELADALPLATANKLQREIVIYSSSRDLPVTRIKPTTIENAEHATIALSYLKVPGFEHYDGVEELKTPQTPKKKRKEKTIEKNTTPKKCVSSTPNVTPRKQAIYVSPKQKCLSRKRQRQPEKWKRNIRKKLRLAGKEYTSTTGKTVQAKGVQDIDCTKCRYKCKSKISQEDRNNIFNAYWSLENYQRQKDFICKNVTEHKPTRILTTAKKPRGRSRVYTFQIERSRLQVCKTFFLKTLDISQKSIDSALKAQNVGTYVKSDGRGRHRPHNATPQALLDDVRKHIESFPVVSAHYTRKDTAIKFLGCDLNIKKMYNLYVDECKAKGKKCVGHTVYRKTFCEEYNFSFHVPKKDQCPICTVYQQAEETGEITEALRAEYEDHQKRKIMARNEKDLDKKFCKEKDSYHVATFDLEAVLPVPCSLISQVYYKRKLACYNLSVYSLADGKATCYLWNESEGKRGSCEIATCLLLYLKSLSCMQHVCFYSDSCTGQNRNRFVFTALLHAVITLPNITVIDQKFLETGHTQMECDSMHAAIEKAKRITSVYVPSQWDTVVRMARKKNPYTVVPIKHGDILNFKPTTKQVMPISSLDVKGNKVQWMKIVWLQVRKRNPDSVFFKYSFNQTEFNEMKVKRVRRGCLSIENQMPRSYKEKLPISIAKKNDLLSLCQSNIIPEEFHQYFENIPSSGTTKDCLPSPDAEEKAIDSDED